MEPLSHDPSPGPGLAAPVPPSPRPRPDYSRPFFWMLLLCMALGVAQFMQPSAVLPKSAKAEDDHDFWSSIAGRGGPGITVVKVLGTISMPDKESYYGGDQDVGEQLHKLRKREDIKGIVLRINSPGGSVGTSQEIYQEVKALVAMNKKVVVSMGDVCASGGYYISAPADYIFVNPGTITGSIGVITETMVGKDLIDKLGIQFNVFKSGALKDMGSSVRAITTEERAVFEGIVMGAYNQFVKAVAAGRVLAKETNGRKPILKSEDDVRKLADGRIYLGAEAVKNGLADAEGTIWDAIAKCGELAGLGKDPTLVNTRNMPPLPDLGRFIRGESASSAESLAKLASKMVAHGGLPVLYLYQP